VPGGGVAAVTRVFKVNAKRWKRGWELHIDGVGVTQVRRLNAAEAAAKDYIALDLGFAPEEIDVEIVPDVGDELGRGIAEAKKATAEAERAQEFAAQRNRGVASSLKREGLTGREIAQVLRISPQRVSQLLGSSMLGQSRSRRGGVG
jgi:hypothetical protein